MYLFREAQFSAKDEQSSMTVPFIIMCLLDLEHTLGTQGGKQ